MSVIYIETQPSGKSGEYLLLQTKSSSGQNIAEQEKLVNCEDRMTAAMTNLGLACQWLITDNEVRGGVCIVSDRDGKDQRHGGEHDALFDTIHNEYNYQHNRDKYKLIYPGKVSWLDKIQELARANEIWFTQDQSKLGEVTVKGESFKLVDTAIVPTMFTRGKSVHTRADLLKFDLSGARNKVICLECGQSIYFSQSDEFKAVRRSVERRDRRGNVTYIGSKYLGTPKKLIEEFLERHCLIHGISQ